jgi:hypothetical protein
MNKNKKPNILNADRLNEAAMNAGLLLMTAAATLGVMEVPERPSTHAIIPGQPAIVLATERAGEENNLRRVREDTAPHYVSYSAFQRTPARSGRV